MAGLGLSGQKKSFLCSSIARVAWAADSKKAKLLLMVNPELSEHLGWHEQRPVLLGREAFGHTLREAKKAEADLDVQRAAGPKQTKQKWTGGSARLANLWSPSRDWP